MRKLMVLLACLMTFIPWNETNAQQETTISIYSDGQVTDTFVCSEIDSITFDVDYQVIWMGDYKRMIPISMIDSMSFKTIDNTLLSCPDNNHPHMIDLGLSSGTKWACCNVGAHAPEEYGGYYAWGEISEKPVYNEVTYLYATGVDNNGDGCFDDWHSDVGTFGLWQHLGANISGTQYDVAYIQWGAPWCMPTHDQQLELLNNCRCVWTIENGVNGRRFTGSNGGSIFLPAAGCRLDNDFHRIGSGGYYWSATWDPSNPYYARNLYFSSTNIYYDYNLYRDGGRSVRPVAKN